MPRARHDVGIEEARRSLFYSKTKTKLEASNLPERTTAKIGSPLSQFKEPSSSIWEIICSGELEQQQAVHCNISESSAGGGIVYPLDGLAKEAEGEKCFMEEPITCWSNLKGFQPPRMAHPLSFFTLIYAEDLIIFHTLMGLKWISSDLRVVRGINILLADHERGLKWL